MLFNSIEYLIFLPLVILSIDIIRNKDYQSAILLIASYFFYFYSAGEFIFIMGIITLISYIAGNNIYNSDSQRYKIFWLSLSLGSSLLILGYYKYYNFFASNINQIFVNSFPSIDIILPIGISFYTFEAISYVVDIYRGTSPPAKSLKIYALYISFFPHLVAGPIVLSRELLPQIGKMLMVIPENISYGAIRISWGLFKKVAIADNLAPIVSRTLDAPIGHSSSDIIIATLLFGIQIYCDFSGYCDIALGSARIIGIKLPENFKQPYFSPNPSDFWRRWHITLGRFILNYVYIPLGGNRKGVFRTYCNSIFAMLLCGLWHGAAWHFVLWGGYHGICLAGHKIIESFSSHGNIRESGGYWVISLLITQYLMFMGWIFFRVTGLKNISYCVNKYIFIDFIIQHPLPIVPVIICVFTVLYIILQKIPLKEFSEKIILPDYFEKFVKLWVLYQIIIILSLAFIMYLLAAGITPVFIYFQF